MCLLVLEFTGCVDLKPDKCDHEHCESVFKNRLAYIIYKNHQCLVIHTYCLSFLLFFQLFKFFASAHQRLVHCPSLPLVKLPGNEFRLGVQFVAEVFRVSEVYRRLEPKYLHAWYIHYLQCY